MQGCDEVILADKYCQYVLATSKETLLPATIWLKETYKSPFNLFRPLILTYEMTEVHTFMVLIQATMKAYTPSLDQGSSPNKCLEGRVW